MTFHPKKTQTKLLMARSEQGLIFKVLLIGDSGVGKSSFLTRYTDDEFEEGKGCTIGIQWKEENV